MNFVAEYVCRDPVVTGPSPKSLTSIRNSAPNPVARDRAWDAAL
jgi:hypothetical protein